MDTIPELEKQVADLSLINEALEAMAGRINELEEECAFWRNEYEELLMAVGGTDPRHE